MAYGRINATGQPVVGKLTPMSGAAALTQIGAKMGLGKDTKAAQRNQDMQDQLYAVAMRNQKTPGKKSGQTAAVSMKQPNRKTTTVAKSSTPVPKRKPTRAPGVKMTTMARK